MDTLRIDRWLHCCRFFKTRSQAAAAEARTCYAEDEAVIRERQAKVAALRQDRLLMPTTDGRPDKRTRRKLRERRGR